MPPKLIIFVGRLFLDIGAVAVSAVIGAIAWAFTSWETGLLIAAGADVALCIYSTFLKLDWNFDFCYDLGIARLKSSLAAGKTPDQALATFLEDLGRSNATMKEWLTLEVDSLRKGAPADVELLASTVAVLSTKAELEAEHKPGTLAPTVTRIMTEMKPRWIADLQSTLESRRS
jgi:hypothetical protein